MILGMLGPIQLVMMIIIGLLIPIGIFILGFYLGKKAGYIKRIKETEGRV